MSEQKVEGHNRLYEVLSKIYYVVGLNVCFALSNLLFIIALLVLKIEFQNTIFFIIALIPTGPSITAMFSVVGKFIREDQINPFEDYFKAYKLNFKDSMKIWSIQLVVLIIIIVDIRYMLVTENQVLVTLFKPMMLISGVIVAISVYLYAILSRFKLRTVDLIKISVMFTFRKLPLSIMNIFIMGVLFYISFVKSPMIMAIAPVLLVYILMFLQVSTLNEIENDILVQA